MPTTRLTLRRIKNDLYRDNAYRVLCDDIEVGSIGVQIHRAPDDVWTWGIDTVVPRQSFPTDGQGTDRDDCMRKFRTAWNTFVADPKRYAEFMETKRKRL